jgi:fluoroacetyl-CoA thioesterase
MTLKPGLVAELSHTVTDADTAIALDSGRVPVLATPRLLAWAEEATVRAVDGELDAGETSVGTRIQLEHLRPTGVGGTVTMTARLAHVDDRLLRFEVTAVDGTGVTVGHGQITRVVVDRDRFFARLPKDD